MDLNLGPSWYKSLMLPNALIGRELMLVAVCKPCISPDLRRHQWKQGKDKNTIEGAKQKAQAGAKEYLAPNSQTGQSPQWIYWAQRDAVID